jgi:hypothetical protein
MWATGPAQAAIALYPGMEIRIGNLDCTAGFFGENGSGQSLIVTAGHCSDYVGEQVTDGYGNPIGTVGARRDDERDSAVGPFGYTLIWRDSGAYIGDRFFTQSATAAVGDPVAIDGERTRGTQGSVLNINVDDSDPTWSVIQTTAFDDHGDSGGPMFEAGPTLVGMTIGEVADTETGGFVKSFGIPIYPLVRLIRATAGSWGDDFRMLVKY